MYGVSVAIKIRRLQATIMLEFASLAQRRLQRFCNPSSFERVGSSPTGGSKIYIMLQLKLIEILSFYDIPQIILAKDKNNIKYIGVLQPNGQDYLFVKIENQDLEQLKCGEIDLLSVLTNKSNYFIAKLKSRSSKILSGKEISINKINTFMLPDSGFYLK